MAIVVAGGATTLVAAEPAAPPDFQRLEQPFTGDVRALLTRYCDECHSGKRTEADVDLATFTSLADVRKQPKVWQKVAEMLDSAQMPPKDSKQLTAEERSRLQRWVRDFLTLEASARAGDPGPVVLRRLSNAEYTYTLRDLTGVATLDPAREFPVDSAAGEGFTNVGNALVMSPSLLTKYLDAAKEVAEHAVLLPDGIRFSSATTRRDWTNECLTRIREFYAAYAGEGGGSAVNLQGIQFDTNKGGRLPVERYLAATIAERESLAGGRKTIEAVAKERGLSAKYLGALWRALTSGESRGEHAPLDVLRARWRMAKPDDVPALAASVGVWQNVLWKFNSIGHFGAQGGVKSWMEAVSPIISRQEFKVKLPVPPVGQDVVLYLAAGDAGDGNEHDFAVWERPRFVAPGRPDLLLRDVRRVAHELAARRDRHFAQTAKCLVAAAEAGDAPGVLDVPALARKHKVDADSLAAWLDYLGIGNGGTVRLGTPISRRIETASGYDFVKGWIGDDALSVVANSSDQLVRIPGTLKPHSIAVHPAPTLSVAVGWRSPVAATMRIAGFVQHAHVGCGNGVAWSLELRRGNTRQRLAAGNSQGETVIPIGPFEKTAVQTGDVVTLVINPRDGNHSCDLTAIDMTLSDGAREWNLARDISSDILAGNPHPDGLGNPGVWHFYSEPASGATGHVIPDASLLAKWQSTADAAARSQLAEALQRLLQDGGATLSPGSPDAALYQQLTSFSGPFMSAALQAIAAKPAEVAETTASKWGLDPARFGKHPDGRPIESASLCVKAPTVLEVRLPADLVAGAEFVATGAPHADSGPEGAVQLWAQTSKPEDSLAASTRPILALEGGPARRRLEAAFDEFRGLFPPALCYTKIVPVDEVVTLTLYYREDEHLRRLMLDERQAAQLDRMWDELLYVAREPLEMMTAFEQIAEFATQDSPALVKALAPLRKPVLERAAAFRQRLVDDEPRQLAALVEFAGQAYRRPLTDGELKQLRGLYDDLRRQEISHSEALHMSLARVLVAPAFLYRAEKPGPGAAPGPVTDWELASRLSYFLWSSQPDEQLRELAAAGKLRDPDVLVAQTQRMLRDPKTRRLATEFACHWLHIHDFDHLDEKSERHFPTFGGLRGAMYEESILFFTDLFQNDRSVLEILDADHTFLNEELARHYGIPDVTGPEWRRVDGVQRFSRGGILTQATTLAKQSGASRTSPILRGNWLSEVVLGEKLPRPPKNVPQLSDTVPEGLTERQLIERHSGDPACVKCHVRIDPFGFALEGFDAIGRLRVKDASGLAIDTKTALPDGTKIEGLAGLKDYLLNARREAFVRQFERKLLGYALGRAVQLSDEPLLADMQARLKTTNYRIGTVLEAVVRSRQFREIRGREAVVEE